MTSNRLVMKHLPEKDFVLEILFRQLTDPAPTLWKPGYHWQVEAYERGMEQPPIAIGWVLDTSPGRPVTVAPENDPHEPDLECVRVFRDFGDAEVAHAIIEAARMRWPNLNVRSGSSEEGRQRIDAYLKSNRDTWVVVDKNQV